MTIQLSSKPDVDVTEERLELFKLDGQSYTIPKRIRTNITLKYLKAAKKDGEAAASAFLLEELLGEEAYDALCEAENLTPEILTQIIEMAVKVTLGGLETPNS